MDKGESGMSSNTIDLARRLAELGQKEDAQQAYLMVLQEVSELSLIHI